MTRWRGWGLAAVLLTIGAVLIHTHTHDSAPSPPLKSVEPEASPEYFAENTAECGVFLLYLSSSEAGPFKRVMPIGPNQPIHRLRRNVWEHGRYRIRGHFTGKDHALKGCASYPEFEVHEFRPWLPVQRCASPGAADPIMLMYTGDLPEDRYAPEDFIEGPPLRSIDDMSCRLIGACVTDLRHPGARVNPETIIDGDILPAADNRYCHPEVQCHEAEKRVTACSGQIWCCPLEPERDASSPAGQEP